MHGSYTFPVDEVAGVGGILGAMAGMIAVIGIVSLLLSVFMIVCMWKIYVKAGYAGWKSLIPFYNVYVLFQMTWGSGIKFLLMFIPFVGLIIGIITYWKFVQVFGGGVPAFILMLFFPVVILPIMAFGREAVYVGDFPGNDF